MLVGDIGGTNARLSLWAEGDKGYVEVHHENYPTRSFATFELALREFLSSDTAKKYPPSTAALACAGPAEDNRCTMTNLGWVVDGSVLQEDFDMRVAVLNDFEAVGYAIPTLSNEDLVVINPGKVKHQAPKIVMGPGTGLGAAQMMWDEGRQAYKVWPGEGAHATLAPRGWKQTALAQYMTQKEGHCEIEYVACGKGLEMIYEFLATDETYVYTHPTGPFKKADKEITQAANAGSDPLAVETVDIFLSIVGAEAGNMALRCLAKGGVYICGGIVPRVIDRARAGALLQSYLNPAVRPAFNQLLASIPLFVVTNPKAGIIGCREYAVSLLKK